MLTTFITLALIHASDVAQVIHFAPPPLDPTSLLNTLFTWLVKILSAAAALFFVVDLFRHVASSPRDLRAVGTDALAMVVLLAVAAKADVLIVWAQTAL